MAVARKNTQYPPFRLVVLALVIAVVLSALTVQLKKDEIALSLTQEVNKALVFAGLPLVSVSFEGRDGTISGVLGSEPLPEQVVDVASQVNGVRRIDNQLQVNTAVDGAGDTDSSTGTDDADFENGLYVPPDTTRWKNTI